jgi:hypothetical protein
VHQNDPKHLKKLIFFENAGTTAFPNVHLKCFFLNLNFYNFLVFFNYFNVTISKINFKK